MDGLMFDTERLGLEGWRQAAHKLGIEIPDELIAAMRGTSTANSRRMFNAAVAGDRYDEAHRIRVRYADEQIERYGLPVKSGLHELLCFLAQKEIPAVLATSTAREKALHYLELAGVREQFAACVFGEEVARPKPAPDIFLAAAAAVNTPPTACLVLEDSPNGLRAARGAHCVVAVIPDLTPAPPVSDGLWDYCFKDLNQVITLLK